MNVRRLKIARKKIDKIDNKIFYLIKRRTEIVKYMLTLKKFKKQIIDHRRIKEILKKIRRKSIRNGVDPKIAERIWKSMIWAYVNFQRKNFKKKKSFTMRR